MLNIVLFEPEIPANTGNPGKYRKYRKDLCGDEYQTSSDRATWFPVK